MTTKANSIAGAVERYVSEQDRYRQLAGRVVADFRAILDDAKISGSVSGREKDIRSFQKKLFLKNYDDPWGQLTDKAGVRVVFQEPRDVDVVTGLVQKHYGECVLAVEDKRQVMDPKELGYSGVHIRLLAYSDLGTRETLECEVQLRTAAQDSWSVVSHRLLYKPVLELPPKLQHAAYRLVALVELFDEEVQRILDYQRTQPGMEVVDLIDIAEGHYLQVANSPSNREFSALILAAIPDAFSANERANYAALLEAYVESERQSLIRFFEDYGPHSQGANIADYILVGQAESLILLERLSARPHLLTAAWKASGLPDSFLTALADAYGYSLPD